MRGRGPQWNSTVPSLQDQLQRQLESLRFPFKPSLTRVPKVHDGSALASSRPRCQMMAMLSLTPVELQPSLLGTWSMRKERVSNHPCDNTHRFSVSSSRLVGIVNFTHLGLLESGSVFSNPFMPRLIRWKICASKRTCALLTRSSTATGTDQMVLFRHIGEF